MATYYKELQSQKLNSQISVVRKEQCEEDCGCCKVPHKIDNPEYSVSKKSINSSLRIKKKFVGNKKIKTDSSNIMNYDKEDILPRTQKQKQGTSSCSSEEDFDLKKIESKSSKTTKCDKEEEAQLKNNSHKVSLMEDKRKNVDSSLSAKMNSTYDKIKNKKSPVNVGKLDSNGSFVNLSSDSEEDGQSEKLKHKKAKDSENIESSYLKQSKLKKKTAESESEEENHSKKWKPKKKSAESESEEESHSKKSKPKRKAAESENEEESHSKKLKPKEKVVGSESEEDDYQSVKSKRQKNYVDSESEDDFNKSNPEKKAVDSGNEKNKQRLKPKLKKKDVSSESENDDHSKKSKPEKKAVDSENEDSQSQKSKPKKKTAHYDSEDCQSEKSKLSLNSESEEDSQSKKSRSKKKTESDFSHDGIQKQEQKKSPSKTYVLHSRDGKSVELPVLSDSDDTDPEKDTVQRKQKKKEKSPGIEEKSDVEMLQTDSSKTINKGKRKQKKEEKISFSSGEDSDLEEIKTAISKVISDNEEDVQLKKCSVVMHDIQLQPHTNSLIIKDLKKKSKDSKTTEKTIPTKDESRERKMRRDSSSSDVESIDSSNERENKSRRKLKSKKKTESDSSDDFVPTKEKKLNKTKDDDDDDDDDFEDEERSIKNKGKRITRHKKMNSLTVNRSDSEGKQLRTQQQLKHYSSENDDSSAEHLPLKSVAASSSHKNIKKKKQKAMHSSSEEDKSVKSMVVSSNESEQGKRQVRKRRQVSYRSSNDDVSSTDNEVLKSTGVSSSAVYKKGNKLLRKRQRVQYGENSNSEEDYPVLENKDAKGKKKDKDPEFDEEKAESNSEDSRSQGDDSDYDVSYYKDKTANSKTKKQTQYLSEYEKMLEEKRAKNLEFLKTLGIDEAKTGLSEVVKSRPKREKKIIEKPADFVPRVSNREKKAINYEEESTKTSLYTMVPQASAFTFKEALKSDKMYEEFIVNFSEITNQVDCATPAPIIYNKNILKKLSAKTSTNKFFKPTVLSWYPSAEYLVLAVGCLGGHFSLCIFKETALDFCTFPLHSKSVNSLKFNHFNPCHLYSASLDGTFLCCDIEKQIIIEKLNTFDTFDKGCTDFDFMSDSSYLVSLINGDVIIFDKRTRNARRTPEAIVKTRYTCHDSTINTVNVHPVDKNYFVSAGTGKQTWAKSTACIWDVRNMSDPVIELLGSNKTINSATFSPHTGRNILTSSRDGTVNVFDSRNITEDSTKQCKTMKCVPAPSCVLRTSWLPNSDELFAMCINSQRSPTIQIYDENLKVYGTIDDGIKNLRELYVFHPFRSVLASTTVGYLHVSM